MQNFGKFYEILGILSSTSGNFHVIIIAGTLGSSRFSARYVTAERRHLGRFCSETATANSGKSRTFIPMVGELQHILCGSSGRMTISQIDGELLPHLYRFFHLSLFTRARKAEADPVSKLRGGDFSDIVKSQNGFAALREMKNTSQHCCDKTMDGKMALYRECCFPDCKNFDE